MTVLKNDALIVPTCWECVLPNTHTDMQASGSLKGQGATGRRRAVTQPSMSVTHTQTRTHACKHAQSLSLERRVLSTII